MVDQDSEIALTLTRTWVNATLGLIQRQSEEKLFWILGDVTSL